MSLKTKKKMSISRRKNALLSINLSKSFLSIIEGELLGDGNLRREYGFQGRYKHDNKYRSYIVWLKNIFTKNKIPTSKIYKRVMENSITYSFYTYSTKEFGELYKKWYPNNKKVPPQDLILNKKMLLHWYLGDGSLVFRSGRNKNNKSIRIYTDAFSKKSIINLIKQIKNLVGISPTYQKSRNCIFIKDNDVIRFIKFLGKSPVKCYKYKLLCC